MSEGAWNRVCTIHNFQSFALSPYLQFSSTVQRIHFFSAKMPYKRRKNVRGDGHLKKSWRTKRRTKDLDEIDEDIKEDNAKKLLNQEIDLDKPGSAQYYCVHCARYFINTRALEDHFNTKVHKRRLKALEIEPYTIEESERAAGYGSWVVAKKRKIETLTVDNFNKMDDDRNEVSQPKVMRIEV